MKKIKSAFSLIEMAIVLTIIGILSSTVYITFELRTGAALRLAIKEMEVINASFNNFYDSLEQIPGDFSYATRYWSDDCSNASICNGDNDQVIEAYKESHLTWLHMSLAGFYDGHYTGQGDGDDETQTANINVPKSSIQDAQYSMLHYNWDRFPDEHMVIIGGRMSGDIGQAAILDPNTAYEIDRKIDDGLPGSGYVYGRNGWKVNWTSTTCVIDSSGDKVDNSESKNTTWTYNMNVATLECIVGVRIKNNVAYNPPR